MFYIFAKKGWRRTRRHQTQEEVPGLWSSGKRVAQVLIFMNGDWCIFGDHPPAMQMRGYQTKVEVQGLWSSNESVAQALILMWGMLHSLVIFCSLDSSLVPRSMIPIIRLYEEMGNWKGHWRKISQAIWAWHRTPSVAMWMKEVEHHLLRMEQARKEWYRVWPILDELLWYLPGALSVLRLRSSVEK